jgi:hypothetical protein
MARGVDTRSRGSVSVTESIALVLKEAALRIDRTGSMSVIAMLRQQCFSCSANSQALIDLPVSPT